MPFSIDTYENFCDRLTSSNSTKIFLNIDNGILQGILFTRFISHILPAWYSHLIIIRTGIGLIKSHICHAQLYDYAIDYYEQNNLYCWFYVQPINYEHALNVPVRKYSKKLGEYQSIIIDTVKPGISYDSILIKSLLNDRQSSVDVRIIMKAKKDRLL